MTSRFPADRALFASNPIGGLISKNRSLAKRQIEELPADELLTRSVDAVVEDFVKAFEIEPLVLGEPRAFEAEDVPEPRRVRPDHWIFVEIPFHGDGDLFSFRPNRFTYNPPLGYVGNGIVRIRHAVNDTTYAPQAKAALDQIIKHIETNVSWLNEDLRHYNGYLPVWFREWVEERRQRTLEARGIVASLGFQLKKRDEPTSYAASVRRKVQSTSKTLALTVEPFVPQPELTNDQYEEILAVIQRMSEVMERSPSSFASMDEESLRTHFLVQLNGTFESPATGETFNAGGKTDIFLRENGGNVFVGECKFWSGAGSFGGIVDQLLSYTTWRDTKTAIILFSRNREGFASVLEKAKDAAARHPLFVRPLAYAAANAFRAVFRHPDDPHRETIVTTLVFDVPQGANGAKNGSASDAAPIRP